MLLLVLLLTCLVRYVVSVWLVVQFCCPSLLLLVLTRLVGYLAYYGVTGDWLIVHFYCPSLLLLLVLLLTRLVGYLAHYEVTGGL